MITSPLYFGSANSSQVFGTSKFLDFNTSLFAKKPTTVIPFDNQ